jgi:hypothetical protein
MSAIVFTYVIRQGGYGGAVKIGKTGDLKKRLGQLQTASPQPLVLLWVGLGDHERSLHELLDAWRLCGEWFDGDSDFLETMAELLRDIARSDWPIAERRYWQGLAGEPMDPPESWEQGI